MDDIYLDIEKLESITSAAVSRAPNRRGMAYISHSYVSLVCEMRHHIFSQKCEFKRVGSSIRFVGKKSSRISDQTKCSRNSNSRRRTI